MNPRKRLKLAFEKMDELADMLHRNNADPDIRRYVALAKTSFEQGAMWLEKAMTLGEVWTPPDEEEGPSEEEAEEGDAEVDEVEEEEKRAAFAQADLEDEADAAKEKLSQA